MASIHRLRWLLPEGKLEDLEPKAYGEGDEYNNHRVKKFGN